DPCSHGPHNTGNLAVKPRFSEFHMSVPCNLGLAVPQILQYRNYWGNTCRPVLRRPTVLRRPVCFPQIGKVSLYRTQSCDVVHIMKTAPALGSKLPHFQHPDGGWSRYAQPKKTKNNLYFFSPPTFGTCNGRHDKLQSEMSLNRNGEHVNAG